MSQKSETENRSNRTELSSPFCEDLTLTQYSEGVWSIEGVRIFNREPVSIHITFNQFDLFKTFLSDKAMLDFITMAAMTQSQKGDSEVD